MPSGEPDVQTGSRLRIRRSCRESELRRRREAPNERTYSIYGYGRVRRKRPLQCRETIGAHGRKEGIVINLSLYLGTDGRTF